MKNPALANYTENYKRVFDPYEDQLDHHYRMEAWIKATRSFRTTNNDDDPDRKDAKRLIHTQIGQLIIQLIISIESAECPEPYPIFKRHHGIDVDYYTLWPECVDDYSKLEGQWAHAASRAAWMLVNIFGIDIWHEAAKFQGSSADYTEANKNYPPTRFGFLENLTESIVTLPYNYSDNEVKAPNDSSTSINMLICVMRDQLYEYLNSPYRVPVADLALIRKAVTIETYWLLGGKRAGLKATQPIKWHFRLVDTLSTLAAAVPAAVGLSTHAPVWMALGCSVSFAWILWNLLVSSKVFTEHAALAKKIEMGATILRLAAAKERICPEQIRLLLSDRSGPGVVDMSSEFWALLDDIEQRGVKLLSWK